MREYLQGQGLQSASISSEGKGARDRRTVLPASLVPPLQRETRVKQAPLAIGQSNVLPHILDFRFPGDQLLVHPAVAPSLEFVRQTPQFAVKDIPGPIGDDVRLVLVEKLLHSGFLQLI